MLAACVLDLRSNCAASMHGWEFDKASLMADTISKRLAEEIDEHTPQQRPEVEYETRLAASTGAFVTALNSGKSSTLRFASFELMKSSDEQSKLDTQK